MLSIFGLPKAFSGHTAVIQANAIKSWIRVAPEVEILLFGDDPGVAEFAASFGIRHTPKVARNDYGTPLISDVFRQAQQLATFPIVCYANADIILGSDLADAVQRASAWRPRFLLVGRRTNLEIREPLDFQPGWQGALKEKAVRGGTLQDEWWIDYFVFQRGLWEEMPAFAVGRPAWDNWLIHNAVSRGIPVIDATAIVTVVHQDHDYAHVPQQNGRLWLGPERDQNLRLAGRFGTYTLEDATHRLSQRGIERIWSLQPLRRALDRLESSAMPWGPAIAAGRRTFRRLARRE